MHTHASDEAAGHPVYARRNFAMKIPLVLFIAKHFARQQHGNACTHGPFERKVESFFRDRCGPAQARSCARAHASEAVGEALRFRYTATESAMAGTTVPAPRRHNA